MSRFECTTISQPFAAPIWKPSQIDPAPTCPRCESSNTKFCYFNNYSLAQPRYFCKSCRRYWTKGGTLRNVPIGGGCRKSRRPHRHGGEGEGGGCNTVADRTGIAGNFPPQDEIQVSEMIENGEVGDSVINGGDDPMMICPDRQLYVQGESNWNFESGIGEQASWPLDGTDLPDFGSHDETTVPIQDFGVLWRDDDLDTPMLSVSNNWSSLDPYVSLI